MAEARKKLGLPQDKKIVLIFGQAAEFAINTTMVLDRLAKKHDVMLLLVTEIENTLEKYKHIIPRMGFEVKVVEQCPDLELLYDYLQIDQLSQA